MLLMNSDPSNFWEDFNSIINYDNPAATNKFIICDEILNKINDEKIINEIKLEKDLLILWNKISYIFERLDCKRYENKKTKYIKEFNDKVDAFIKVNKNSSYYDDRLRETTSNESDKLRYSFICWFITKNKDYLNQTIEIALNYISNFIKSKEKSSLNYILPCYLLSYSFFLFELYALKDDILKNRIKDSALNIVEDVNSNKVFRWLSEPSYFLLKLLETNKDENKIHELYSYLHQGINYLSKENVNFNNKISKMYIQRDLLEITIDLIKLFKIADERKEELRKKHYELLGNSLEDEGNLRLSSEQNGQLIASKNFLEAANFYKKAGNNKKYNHCMNAMRQYNKLEYYSCDEIRIEHTISKNITINKSEVIPSIINIFSKFITDLSDTAIQNEIYEKMDEHPLSYAIPVQKMSEIGKSGKVLNEENEIKESTLQDYKILCIQYFESSFTNEINNLEIEKNFSFDCLNDFIKKSKFLYDDISLLIETGLKHHFDKQYVASISILTTQLEAIIRNLLEFYNENFLKEKEEKIMYKEFGGLLNMDEIKNLIGQNMVSYLKLKYTEINGENLRNKISHGYLKFIEYNYKNSIMLIITILKLISID